MRTASVSAAAVDERIRPVALIRYARCSRLTAARVLLP